MPVARSSRRAAIWVRRWRFCGYSPGSGSHRSAGRSRISVITAASSSPAADGSTRSPSPIWSRCASSCPDQRAARSAISIGMLRAGLAGGFAAWLGFTMPSALALIAFGYGVAWFGGLSHARLAARPQDRRRRCGRPGGLGDGAQPLPRRERATLAVRRGDHGDRASVGGRADRRDRSGRADRLVLASQPHCAPLSPPIAVVLPRAWSIAALALFFCAACRAAGADCRSAKPAARVVRRFLSRRRAGVRRRSCGAAAAASRGRAAGLGVERRLSRRLWRGAGGSWPAVHLCRLSRRGDGSGAERLARRPPVSRRDLPAVASCC